MIKYIWFDKIKLICIRRRLRGYIMSDLVTIECPNCGGKMVRKTDEYFAKCQFCGGEVCFDEIKEEVQLGVYKKKINKYENTINSYRQDYAIDESKRKSLKQWILRIPLWF